MRNTLLTFCVVVSSHLIAQGGLDPTSHVFVIVMENHTWSNVKGSADAPYINNTVLPMASYCDQYYTPVGVHPSEPNYLWLEAGTNFGVTNDNDPPANHQTSPAHFVTQLKNAGISWKTYQESIDGISCPSTDSYPYAVHHNPFAYFDDIVNSSNPVCTAVMRPFSELATDLGNNTVAQYNFITPNLCNDMHNSCAPTNNLVKQGDNWLSANLPVILNSTAYQNNGLIIFTFDEGDNQTDGPIGCIVLSPLAKGGGYHNSIRYTHSSTLRTLQKIFGVGPFLGGAASGTDLADLFVAGAIPDADPPPTVVTTSASNVGGGNATLGGTINPNGDTTSTWFEYGLTSAYGSNTKTSGADDAESYSGWANGATGGTGLGPMHVIEAGGGGTFLVNSTTDPGRQIDGAQSFGVYAGSGGEGVDRQILGGQQAGTVSLSARFDVSNTPISGQNGAFAGFNLKTAEGTHFGDNELVSVGLRTGNGNTTVAVNGGAQTISLGSELRGVIIDFVLSYDGLSGTYLLGAKLRGNTTYTYTSGNLKASNVTPAYLGFGNFFNSGSNQNAIFDSISLTGTQSAGNGTSPVSKVYILNGSFTPNTTYHYRAVGQNSRGITYGDDQTFGFPLIPPNGAAFHSTTSSSGAFQARVYDDTGHIEIAEPDLNGTPFANVITFAPPSAKIGGSSFDFGRVLAATNIANGLQLTQSLAGTTVITQLTLGDDGIMHYEVTDWNGLAPTETDVTAASNASEHFYGFGEKFNSLDQAGNKVHIMTSDIGGDKNDFSYKSSSWFMSNRGYGFHLDSTAESYFDMRNGAADRYTIQNLIGKLKFNVVPGPKLTDVLSRYTGMVGRPYLPPPWVFGTWVSSDIWRNGGEVRYAVTRYRDSGIPISVFVFDSPWEVGYNDFNWNMTQFGAAGDFVGTSSHPDSSYLGFNTVTEMMTFLQQNGVKVICWLTPFINSTSNPEAVPGQAPSPGKSSNYDTAATNDYFVHSSTSNSAPLSVGWWKGTGSPVDFTKPAAKNWFITTQLQPLIAGSNVMTGTGSEPAIGGFKTDDGETINSGPPYIPLTAAYADGRTGAEMQNGYCIEYHKTVSSVLGPNGILFARSGFNGTGAYPAGWPGDNEPNYTQTDGLQSVITAGDSAAMSGFAIWGSDIGGYELGNPANDQLDLFMRWTQYGAFCPIMQMHRQISTNLQYPWSYDTLPSTTGLDNYRMYAKLHSQLFPYIYTYANEASVDGLPIIRPEVLLNQTDSGTYGIQHTYYFGNELLVAPMNAANSTSRSVYLPVGNWYDYWTNAKYTGGQNLIWSNSDTTKMPLFVAENSIIPMLTTVPQSLNTANYVHNPGITTIGGNLQFLVYPGSSTPPPVQRPTPGAFKTYLSMGDQPTAQCSVSGTVTTVTISSIGRAITLKVFATAAPTGVERNGIRLPNVGNQSAFDSTSLGWFYDSTAKFLYIKFQHTGGSATISFGPDSVGDGVTDSWRQYYGITDDTADADGDGKTNAQEYFAGTNPNDPQSAFAMSSIGPQNGGGFIVNWPSQLGIVYRVEWKNSLTDLMWHAIAPDVPGTGATLNWTDDGSQTGGLSLQRFYRVEIP